MTANPAAPTFGTEPGPTAAPAVVDALAGLLDILDLDGAAKTTDGSVDTAAADTPPSSAVATTEPTRPVPTDAPHDRPCGEHFMDWLRHGISTHKLIINDAKALVHTVTDTLYLVSPGVFQRYAQEHPDVAALARADQLTDWQWVQKRFERLQRHRKQVNGLNIWTCEVTGPRKSRRLHGYLLADPQVLLATLPPNNPYLTLATLPDRPTASVNAEHPENGADRFM